VLLAAELGWFLAAPGWPGRLPAAADGDEADAADGTDVSLGGGTSFSASLAGDGLAGVVAGCDLVLALADDLAVDLAAGVAVESTGSSGPVGSVAEG
jgi:hypothetical protein